MESELFFYPWVSKIVYLIHVRLSQLRSVQPSTFAAQDEYDEPSCSLDALLQYVQSTSIFLADRDADCDAAFRLNLSV